MSVETADSRFNSGNYVDAIAIYEKSLTDIMEKIATAHQRFGTHQLAIEAWTRLLDALPKYETNRISIALSNRGECRAMRNDFDGAMADLNRSVSMARRSANLNMRASLFCATNQYELELEGFTKKRPRVRERRDVSRGFEGSATSKFIESRKGHAGRIASDSPNIP